MAKKTNLTDLRQLTTKQLADKLSQERLALLGLRQDLLLGKLKDYRQIRLSRRLIAQISTAIDEKITAGLAAQPEVTKK